MAVLRGDFSSFQKIINAIKKIKMKTYLGNARIVKLLIENGANVNVADNDGQTPLYLADIIGNLIYDPQTIDNQ